MKQKILSVLLAALLLFGCAAFAFAEEPAGAPGLASSGYLMREGETFTRFDYFLVMDERFVAATPSLLVTVSHSTYFFEDETPQITTDRFDGSAVMVVPGSFFENGKQITRLQLIVPKTFDESEVTTELVIAAGSFADSNGNTNDEIVITEIGRRDICYEASYFCKVLQVSGPLSSALGVGEGDKVRVECEAPVPFQVTLDGNLLAEVPGEKQEVLAFSAAGKGEHTLTFRVQDMICETVTFTVYSQMDIYRRQRDSSLAEVLEYAPMTFLPLLALPLTMILPPLGVAALAGPAVSALAVLEAVASVFRVVNLLRK